MHARPRSIAALLIAPRGRGARDDRQRTGVGGPGAARRPSQTCAKPAPAQRRHHPHPGLPARHPREAAEGGPRREDHRRGRPGQGRRRGHQQRHRRLRHRRCPGKSIDILGNTYTVKIDKTSLPEGAALRNPKQVVAEGHPQARARTSSSPSRSATRPPPSAGKATQALQLAVGGIVFSLLLAMAALGLSMIFGTTGLTNFAHGELITFGALVAYGVDALPGTITIGGTNVTIAVAIVVAAIASGRLRLAQRQGPVAAAAAPRHRPDRDDGREHRPVDLPAQRLPVRRRRRHPPVLPVLQPARRTTRARSWSRPRTSSSCVFSTRRPGRRSSSPCSAPGSARPPARSPTTRRCASATGINVDRVISVVWIVGADARRPVGRAARHDPGLRLPARLQDPAAGLRRDRPRRSRHDRGARSSAPSSSASSSRSPRCSSRPSSSSSAHSSCSSSFCWSGRRACSARPSGSVRS